MVCVMWYIMCVVCYVVMVCGTWYVIHVTRCVIHDM